MSTKDEERMREILFKKNLTEDRINKIMNDLKKDGVFDDVEIEDEYDDIDCNIEKKADEVFSAKEKIRSINLKSNNVNIFFNKIEEEEQKEIIIIKKDIKENVYRRSPLHEAICSRDIEKIKNFVDDDMYIDSIDNNGHSPLEMAYYEGYIEAIEIIKNKLKNIIDKETGLM